MEHENLLPRSQEPAIGPYPEPDESSPHFPTLFPKIHKLFMCLTKYHDMKIP